MPESVSPSILEFLAWVSRYPRTYADTMEAWRSTCPRNTPWEDAVVGELIEVGSKGALGVSEVTLTARGKAILAGKEHPPVE